MVRLHFLALIIFSVLHGKANLTLDTSFNETSLELTTIDGKLYGTLLTPKIEGKIPVALIVSGSGPTDRDGNSVFTNNNCLKKLAESLCSKNVASLRFDKRGVGQSKGVVKSESSLNFQDYIDDVEGWVKLLKVGQRFTKIIIIGHSEGSLIGMAASQSADMFISIAGVSRRADVLLREQLSRLPKQFKDTSLRILENLTHGIKVDSVPEPLFTLFRPSAQPYLISWFQFDPTNIIKEIKIPILVIQGENDLQVPTKDAVLLAGANHKAELTLIPHMNHILKDVTEDENFNLKTYNDPDMPVNSELVDAINRFIHQK